MDKLRGTIGTLSSMQLTADIEGLDAQSKTILRRAEVLAVILRETITEYKGYSRKEVMDFIETDSITDTKEVSQGRTNTQVRSDNIEFVQLNEKVSLFDLAFRARNPVLSTATMQISLHVDIESQKNYKPGYPIEKRGLYYLARRLSSQLSLITERTDYSQLEKCYSIWICRDDIPKQERHTVSVYEIANTKNIGINALAKENYDLMTLVVIKLGDVVYNGKKEDEGYDLLRFLNTIMYPHGSSFMNTISDYIDFSENEELWKEAKQMYGLGQCLYKELTEEITDNLMQSVIQAFIEDGIPTNRIFEKLQKFFGLTKEMSEQYYQNTLEKHDRTFTAAKSEYIDSSESEGLLKDEKHMDDLGDRTHKEGREEGIEAMVLDNLEERVSEERIISKLQKYFQLTEELAEHYYKKFASNI